MAYDSHLPALGRLLSLSRNFNAATVSLTQRNCKHQKSKNRQIFCKIDLTLKIFLTQPVEMRFS